MTYTLRDSNGKRVANSARQFLNMPDLLNELGFYPNTTRIDCLAHKHDPNFLAQWVPEKKVLVVEYHSIINCYEVPTSHSIEIMVEGVLAFVRDVYEKGKK